MLGDQKYPAAITSSLKRNAPRDDSKIRVPAALCRASDCNLDPLWCDCSNSNCPVIDTWTWHAMALLFCSILGIATISAAKPLDLLTTDQTLRPAIESSSRFPLSSNSSIIALNSTLGLSAPYTICWDESEGFHLEGDQCTEALVNSDFARLPPNEMLTFEPRSSPSLAGQIGLPRRYLSCV